MDFIQLFNQNKEQSISGRYLPLDHIKPLLDRLNSDNRIKLIGHSVLGESIYSFKTGKGKTKILFWSQMHGNESTTTKALFDLFNLLESNTELARHLLN